MRPLPIAEFHTKYQIANSVPEQLKRLVKVKGMTTTIIECSDLSLKALSYHLLVSFAFPELGEFLCTMVSLLFDNQR
jgi:hypothetical protein